MSNAPGDFVDLRVLWDDRSPYGSTLSHRLEQTVRRVLYPQTWTKLSREMKKPPASRKKFVSDDLCRMVIDERSSEDHERVVRDPSFWRFDPELVQVSGFELAVENCGCRVTLPAAAVDCTAMRDWLRGDTGDNIALGALSRSLESALKGASFRRSMLPQSSKNPLMVGHGCVTWSDGTLRLWTDPFLRPKRLRYPPGQQPMSPLDAPEEQHAILITHSHADHFSPESLLLFPRDTIIIVPRTSCESPLAIDMRFRARQMGFADVRPLGWDEQLTVGAFVVTALPFYGEQPLGPHAERAASQDRNQGSTYHVAGPGGRTALFLADAGSDPAGSSLDLARRIRTTHGAVDLVFGNHRRWRVYPPQFITTSVPQNLCYVPDAELDVPQQMMLTPEELQAIGQVLSARHVIPYAMGNAPWFAEIGLGPETQVSDHVSAFDAPLDESIDGDRDTLVKPSARLTVVGPAEHIGIHGPERDGRLDPIDAAAFSARKRKKPVCAPRSLAIGGALSGQCVRDLLELTRIDPSSYLIASAGFLEIVTDGSNAPEFLWELAARLVREPEWMYWSTTPLIAGAFGGDASWLSRFEHAHRRASMLLREADPGLDPIGALVDELRPGVSPHAIEAVARELLGIGIRVAPSSLPALCSRSPTSVDATPDHGIELPQAADAVVGLHGAAQVTAALLIVKLIHNVALTMGALERPRDEPAMFAFFLGADRDVPNARPIPA